MMKRLGDVTQEEAESLCKGREDCENCPYVLFRSYVTRKSRFGSVESITKERVCIMDLAEWNSHRIRLKESGTDVADAEGESDEKEGR